MAPESPRVTCGITPFSFEVPAPISSRIVGYSETIPKRHSRMLRGFHKVCSDRLDCNQILPRASTGKGALYPSSKEHVSCCPRASRILATITRCCITGRHPSPA